MSDDELIPFDLTPENPVAYAHVPPGGFKDLVPRHSPDLAAWLRQKIRERLYLAQHAIELGNAAEWTEQSSGVLVTGEPTETDAWHGIWVTGDSSLTRLMEANDPRDTIARCETELAILDLCEAVQRAARAEHQRGEGGGDGTYGRVSGTVSDLIASGYRHKPGYREEWKP